VRERAVQKGGFPEDALATRADQQLAEFLCLRFVQRGARFLLSSQKEFFFLRNRER
jgi:hypothetical protein